MAPTKKQLKNREYCQKYRQKNLEELRKRDKERKKLERDHRKFFQRDKYEEYKKKDRERKAAEKVENIINDSTKTPIPQSSSFKHKCTKIRSLKKAENALPQSPNKKKGIIQKVRNGKNCHFDPPPPYVTAGHVPVDTPSSLRNILARHPPPTT